jgi:hypothetical protein
VKEHSSHRSGRAWSSRQIRGYFFKEVPPKHLSEQNFCLHYITEFEITSIIAFEHSSCVSVMTMVACPVCGKPLVKRARKYFCKSESCSVIFVRCPYELTKMRIAFKALATEEIIAKIEKVIVNKTSHVF